MRKILLVLKNEFLMVVTRKSFILTLVLIPLTGFILLLILSGVQTSTGTDSATIIENLFLPEVSRAPEGFIDESGLIKTLPAQSEGQLIRFSTESEAIEAIHSGQISSYYLIPKDFLEVGDVISIRPDFDPLGTGYNTGLVHDLIAHNLTQGDINLAYRVLNPINPIVINLSEQPDRDSGHWLTFFLPYIVTMLFYIVIMMSSSLMLNTISNEKQNRMMEILMTSITPQQMLSGKIIALGLVGLLQTVVWSGAGLLMLRFSGQAFDLGDAFQLPVSILIWGVLFFIFGYAVYASLMAGIGALVPNLKEASQLTTIVVLPMVVPLIFINALVSTPNSPLSVFFSLFPLTSPVSMMSRLAATSVPIWQVLTALTLLALTAWLLVRASASLFKAQNLLSGQSVNVKGFIRALSGK